MNETETPNTPQSHQTNSLRELSSLPQFPDQDIDVVDDKVGNYSKDPILNQKRFADKEESDIIENEDTNKDSKTKVAEHASTHLVDSASQHKLDEHENGLRTSHTNLEYNKIQDTDSFKGELMKNQPSNVKDCSIREELLSKPLIEEEKTGEIISEKFISREVQTEPQIQKEIEYEKQNCTQLEKLGDKDEDLQLQNYPNLCSKPKRKANIQVYMIHHTSFVEEILDKFKDTNSGLVQFIGENFCNSLTLTDYVKGVLKFKSDWYIRIGLNIVSTLSSHYAEKKMAEDKNLSKRYAKIVANILPNRFKHLNSELLFPEALKEHLLSQKLNLFEADPSLFDSMIREQRNLSKGSCCCRSKDKLVAAERLAKVHVNWFFFEEIHDILHKMDG